MATKKCPIQGMRDCKPSCGWYSQAFCGCSMPVLAEQVGKAGESMRMEHEIRQELEKKKAQPAGKKAAEQQELRVAEE